jgi:hypothetical protein
VPYRRAQRADLVDAEGSEQRGEGDPAGAPELPQARIMRVQRIVDTEEAALARSA